MVGKLPLANSMSSDASLLNTFRPDVLAMHAYVVQDAAGYIKLDAMENPFSLPPALQAELGERLGKVALNRYPGVRVNDLHAALRAYAHVPADHGLVLGNGSDELISLLSVACAQPGAVALAPLPGFVMYEAFAKQTGMTFVGVPLTADFELDAPAMLAAIREHKPALTYIAYTRTTPRPICGTTPSSTRSWMPLARTGRAWSSSTRPTSLSPASPTSIA